MAEMDSKKTKLRATLKWAVSLFEDLPHTDFLICAVTRSEDLEESVSALAELDLFGTAILRAVALAKKGYEAERQI